MKEESNDNERYLGYYARIVYPVIFDDSIPRGVVDFDAVGDYGYRYDQFRERVYRVYRQYASK